MHLIHIPESNIIFMNKDTMMVWEYNQQYNNMLKVNKNTPLLENKMRLIMKFTSCQTRLLTFECDATLQKV